MNICTSCFHAQVKLRKPNQYVLCTSKQNVKNHHKYCHDYLNKERFIEQDESNRKEFERYKELG
jgi:hypothetical protein